MRVCAQKNTNIDKIIPIYYNSADISFQMNFLNLRFNMRQRSVKAIESIIGILILAVLLVIAGSILYKQSRYNPELFDPDQAIGVGNKIADLPTLSLESFAAEGFKAIGGLENYNPGTLYEKINGKADLYLEAGFAELFCQRFVSQADPGLWYEVYVYDMSLAVNAFSVYSAQKRAEIVLVDWTRFGYRTTDALFLSVGKYYVESVASEDSGELLEGIMVWGRNFSSHMASGITEIEESTLFPNEYLVADSFGLKVSDAFGFSGMKNVFTSKYEIDAEEVMAFLSRLPNEQNAKELAISYYNFLIENGASDVESGIVNENFKVTDFYGSTEIIFLNGSYIGGVHEADNLQAALKVAKMLYEKMSGGGQK